jgi:hypothetical protein
MALTSDSLAKQMGSKTAPPLFGLTDGKLKLSYPLVQPLPPGAVNTLDFEAYRTLVTIRAFVSSASESIRSGEILPNPTTKALLNETISELNTAMSESLEWHNAAVEAQSIGAMLPDSKALEKIRTASQGKFLYLSGLCDEGIFSTAPA